MISGYLILMMMMMTMMLVMMMMMMMMMILFIIIIILLPKGYIWARSKSLLEWLLILPSSKDTKDYQNPLFFLGDLQMATFP